MRMAAEVAAIMLENPPEYSRMLNLMPGMKHEATNKASPIKNPANAMIETRS